jgi:3-hydroxybutyryl-CoA dehydrogenase
MNYQINKILVIGAGTMGQGIAQWLAQNKTLVHLADIHSSQIELAEKNILSSWSKLRDKKKFSYEDVESYKRNISFILLSDINNDYDLIIEAVVENLTIKKNLFQELDQTQAIKTIFASNTSSFTMQSLIENLSSERQKRFIGLHFFNPATIMKLVEIISSPNTEESLAPFLYQWFNQRNKVAALCKDSPAFIVNRVARNFYGEALRIVKQEDLEHIQLVDQIMREVGGFNMGPFELMDLIGIDINLDVTNSVWQAFDQTPRFAPHPLQVSMVEAKRLGRKTKKGFYSYE